MKKLILILLLGLSIYSCKKEETPDENTNSSYIKMSIDNGNDIIFNENYAGMLIGEKIILGAASGNKDIQISIDVNSEEGQNATTYLISYGENGESVFTTVTNAKSKSLFIEKYDPNQKEIEGFFTVTYMDNVTQEFHSAKGSFKVKYQ